MATAQEVIQAFNELPAAEQTQAAGEIQQIAPLPRPPANVVGKLWTIVVSTVAFVVAGGLVALVVLVMDDKSTDVIAPIVTTALGFVGGLLAPSPTTK